MICYSDNINTIIASNLGIHDYCHDDNGYNLVGGSWYHETNNTCQFMFDYLDLTLPNLSQIE